MEILVCVKRVPDTAENEIEVNRDGSVTVVTVGDDDCEEVLRREMAMGADKGLLLSDEAFTGSDGNGIATLLKASVEKEGGLK